VIDVNVNRGARQNPFRRLRDELWWEVREEFESEIISIPDDPILIEELLAARIDHFRKRITGKRVVACDEVVTAATNFANVYKFLLDKP
jgi:hypothetical protein